MGCTTAAELEQHERAWLFWSRVCWSIGTLHSNVSSFREENPMPPSLQLTRNEGVPRDGELWVPRKPRPEKSKVSKPKAAPCVATPGLAAEVSLGLRRRWKKSFPSYLERGS